MLYFCTLAAEPLAVNELQTRDAFLRNFRFAKSTKSFCLRRMWTWRSATFRSV